MIRAMIEGRKTQTRRICKRDPFDVMQYRERFVKENSPYQPGDIIWCRESIIKFPEMPNTFVYSADPLPAKIKPGYKTTPGMHMPASACRLWNIVKEVRIEKLLEISEEDCIAQGIETATEYLRPAGQRTVYKNYDEIADYWLSPYNSFLTMWDKINGKKYPGGSNPYVWATTFEVTITPPKEFLTHFKL